MLKCTHWTRSFVGRTFLASMRVADANIYHWNFKVYLNFLTKVTIASRQGLLNEVIKGLELKHSLDVYYSLTTQNFAPHNLCEMFLLVWFTLKNCSSRLFLLM